MLAVETTIRPESVEDLVRALGCVDLDDLNRLLDRTHDLDLDLEQAGAGELRLTGDGGCLTLRLPLTVRAFWDEVDQLEALLRPDR